MNLARRRFPQSVDGRTWIFRGEGHQRDRGGDGAFAQQLDPMMAWDRFKGRWLLGGWSFAPERLENTPTMKEVSRPERWNEKPQDLRRWA